jgi:hypothetical protein
MKDKEILENIKQFENCIKTLDENFAKQETLEEVANRVLDNKYPYHPPQDSRYWKDMFLEGAKWQQEQILDFLYEEITERRDYSASKMCEKVIEFIEQFKNK